MFVPSIRTLTAAAPGALALMALLAAPALAEGPPGAGFWIWPDQPAATAEGLMDLCRHGMTLVKPGGNCMSFLATDAGLVVDAEAVCQQDEGRQICAVHIYHTDGTLTARTHTSRFARDGAGHLTAHLTLDSGRERTSFPQACLDTVVRDLMVGWLAPRPAAPDAAGTPGG